MTMVDMLLFACWLTPDIYPSRPFSLSRHRGHPELIPVLFNAAAIMATCSHRLTGSAAC
jgi:hypothetical protein